jgi:hypothetical protein
MIRTEIVLTVLTCRRDDGTSHREVVVSLRSDPSVSTSFTVIFLNKVAGVSAQFVSNYGFIEVDFNQPVNGRLLGEASFFPSFLPSSLPSFLLFFLPSFQHPFLYPFLRPFL